MKDIHLRFPDEQLHSALKKSAENNRRSLNNEILRAVEYYLKNAPEAQYEVKEVPKKTPRKQA
jgi:hypothetical protein